MEKFQLEQTSAQWMLFTASIKFILNTICFIMEIRSLLSHWSKNNMTESQEHLPGMLQETRYYEYRLDTCADLKVTAMAPVPPCEYTEFCCF